MSRETLIASLQRLASLFCVKSFGQCHISQTSTITLEWRFQYLLSLNHNIGAGLSQREVLDRLRAKSSAQENTAASKLTKLLSNADESQA
ncbi:hypothetical protein T4E_11572 [Trichinella pseudospiralis]|uniref:Uncharacterized protein n=1 Tax=Trichinella pseudospiralis TaxID=6337 RepID=A0A0V0YHL7_TRIPS|nr:hypothetical protein T4E_11572 [Trichinella pseudospiralis]